jgi:hypothetical protein
VHELGDAIIAEIAAREPALRDKLFVAANPRRVW